MDKELHIRSFEDRSIFWEKLKISDTLIAVCESLRALFESTYTKCSARKEKHDRFQFEWYQQCGHMLSDDAMAPACNDTKASAVDSKISNVIPKWREFRRNQLNICPVYHANAVLIAVQGAVFRYLAHTVTKHVPSLVQDETRTTSQSSLPEPNEVYYKFGGAAIAEMLRKRYRSMYSCPQHIRCKIVEEIAVLKGMECSDKSIIPPSLQYRDNGFMYFSDEYFIPYIKSVDDKVKQVANNQGVQEHGRNIVQVTTDKVQANSSFRTKFEEVLLRKFDSLDNMSDAVDSVHAKFLRKLCNTRLGEFMDSYKQIQLSKDGSASLAGQNLRDTLLSQHVHLQSQIS